MSLPLKHCLYRLSFLDEFSRYPPADVEKGAAELKIVLMARFRLLAVLEFYLSPKAEIDEGYEYRHYCWE